MKCSPLTDLLQAKNWEGERKIYFQSRLKCVFGTAYLHKLIIHSKKVFSSFFPDFCCQERTIIDNSLRLFLLVLSNTSFTPKASGQMKAKQRSSCLPGIQTLNQTPTLLYYKQSCLFGAPRHSCNISFPLKLYISPVRSNYNRSVKQK